MPRYMLDTDVCSHIMRRSSDVLLKRLQSVPMDAICISVVTKAELLFGANISPRREQDHAAVAAFLRHVDVLGFPDEAAEHYADIRADLSARGRMIGANDLFIAAHARCLNLTLVTNNVREFGRVRKLDIENWIRAS